MELSRIVLLCKLKLSQKFLREMIHTRKSTLRVGLMKPLMMITILAQQLYFGHAQSNNNTAKIMQTIIDNELIKNRFNRSIIEMPLKYKIDQTTWCNEIDQMLNSRKIEIRNAEVNLKIQTSKKSIKDYAIQYIEEKKHDSNVILLINHIKMRKKMFLLFKLVVING